MREQLDKIYEIATRVLAEPPDGDTGPLVEICTLIEAAAQGKLPQPDLRAALVEARAALAEIKSAVTTSEGQCGVLGTNWAECDYCGAVSQERTAPIPHEKGCAFAVSTSAIARIDAVLEVKP